MNAQPVALGNDAAPASSPAYVYILEDAIGLGRAYFARYDKSITIKNIPASLGGGTHTFLPVQINHADISHTAGFEGKPVTVTLTARNAELQRHFITASTVRYRMWIVRVINNSNAEIESSSPTLDFDADCIIAESGVIGQVAMGGLQIECTVTPEPFAGTLKMPRVFFGRTCQRQFGGAGCNVDIEAIKTTTTIEAADRATRIIQLPIAMPSDNLWRIGNMVHVATKQRAFIEWADNAGGGGHARLRIRTWSPDFQPGDSVDIYPGCALTTAACTAHDNIANFGGFPYVPVINPTAHGAA